MTRGRGSAQLLSIGNDIRCVATRFDLYFESRPIYSTNLQGQKTVQTVIELGSGSASERSALTLLAAPVPAMGRPHSVPS